jgi:hypothetical protein
MRITFAGKFESALIRSVDEIVVPNRNASTHEYYAALNRKVTSNYFDRCGTFIALAGKTLVPTADWNYPYDKKYRGELSDVELGIEHTEIGGNEWDGTRVKFVERLLKQRALSSSSHNYISSLVLNHYPEDERNHINANLEHYQSAAAKHYLCRLFLQLSSARETDSFVVLSEDDIQILGEVRHWISQSQFSLPFDIPDLKGKLIEPESFASGVLNFSPRDVRSVAAVRSDKQVRAYADKISSLLEEQPSESRERKMLTAMVDAHNKSEASKRAEKIFEVVSWLVKPFHYVPGVDAALSAAEDLKDVGMKILDRDISQKGWHLLAVKMTDIALQDYFVRKGNMLSD